MERLPETMRGARLTLRRWAVADAALLGDAVTASTDHLRPWMPWIAAEPLTDAQRVGLIMQWQDDWDQGGDLVIGAFLDDAVIGSAGLHRRRGAGVLEIGYWVHVDHTMKGFATEVATVLTTAAFTVPGIGRVEIHHDRANVASGGVPRRLGYTFADETPDAVTSPGEEGIDCRWVMTRRRWVELTARP
jgi:RimJ/RimL family protein N-acetyltransferase